MERGTQPTKDAGLDWLQAGRLRGPTRPVALCLESHPQDFTVAFSDLSLRFGPRGFHGKASVHETSVLAMCCLDLHSGRSD